MQEKSTESIILSLRLNINLPLMKFHLKSYSLQELAVLYFPNSPHLVKAVNLKNGLLKVCTCNQAKVSITQVG